MCFYITSKLGREEAGRREGGRECKVLGRRRSYVISHEIGSCICAGVNEKEKGMEKEKRGWAEGGWAEVVMLGVS